MNKLAVPAPERWSELAERWQRRQHPSPKHVQVNELGIWWEDERGSTHLMPWSKINIR